MIVLGLTGSIGMGKSTAARMLRRLGLPLHDADACVHGLLAKGGVAVAATARAFPGMDAGGAIDRRKLGNLVFNDDDALVRLTAILHPLVRKSELAFLRRCRLARRRLAVLDIPLLYETGAEKLCHKVILVSAPRFLQRQRVFKRPGFTPARLARIEAHQLPDREKRRRADYIVETGLGLRPTWVALMKAVKASRRGRG